MQKPFWCIITLSGQVPRSVPKAKVIFRQHGLWKSVREMSYWEWTHWRPGVSRWEAISFLGEHLMKQWVCGLIGDATGKGTSVSSSPQGSDIYNRRGTEKGLDRENTTSVFLTSCSPRNNLFDGWRSLLLWGWRSSLVGDHDWLGNIVTMELGALFELKRYSRSLLVHSMSTSLLD